MAQKITPVQQTNTVQTQANTGNAGGNMWWINLGGIKMLWGESAAFSNPSGGTNLTFTLPSFFTAIQSVTSTLNNLGSTANQATNSTTTTTSSIIIATYSASTTVGTETISIFVIGN